MARPDDDDPWEGFPTTGELRAHPNDDLEEKAHPDAVEHGSPERDPEHDHTGARPPDDD